MQRVQSLTLADAVLPRLEAGGRAAVLARDLALMAGFAVFVAICAQVQVRLPWSPVPITGQTFAVLVTGGALGARRGAGSLALYAAAGMAGLPVFTPAATATSGSWDLHLVLPWLGNDGLLWNLTTGGYIAGFILAAALVGWLAERGWDRGARVQAAMLLGTIAVYIPGLLWLGHLIDSGWVLPSGQVLRDVLPGDGVVDKTLRAGLYSYVVGDLMKLLAAAMILPAAWSLVERVKGMPRDA